MAEVFHFALLRDRLYEQVADQIQALIVAESLRPGDRLPAERDLAERLGVSRTVVREALRVLTVRGLLCVKPGCGAYVQELSVRAASAPLQLLLKLRQTPHPYHNLQEVRRTIEVECAGLAASRADACDLERLCGTYARMEEHLHDAEPFATADLDFHLTLAAATHNDLFPVLLAPITELLSEAILVSYYGPGASEAGLAHHCAILDAVQARDAARAREAMCRHIDASERLISALQTGLDASGASGPG